MKWRVLIVSSYPIDNPTSGGQKRASAICDAYRDNGYEVRYISVYHPLAYQERGDDHILMGEEQYLQEFYDSPFASDIIAGECIDRDIHVRSAVATVIADFKPDIVQFEQVFVYAGLSRLLRDMNVHPYLILSSHNIEYEMKRDIYAQLGVDKKLAAKYLQLLEKTEQDASRRADMVVAVSNDDAVKHRKLGASHVVVAPNGIYQAKTTRQALQAFQERLNKHKITTPILFVSSMHQPNWAGFEHFVGRDLGFLPAGAAVMVAGGVTEHFQAAESSLKPKPKSLLLGRVEEDLLGAAIKASDTIVLPINSGGGSNLKTAEAISSGKKVVATEFAFRGYEKYRSLPNVFIADSPDSFRSLLADVAGRDIKLTQAERKFSRTVEWPTALLPLVRSLRWRLPAYALRTNTFRLINWGMRKARSLKVLLRKS